jgi:peroxiredoxin Q/BCP
VRVYGRTCWGTERTTFVIDADGKVVQVLEKVKPKTHDEQVLAVLGG